MSVVSTVSRVPRRLRSRCRAGDGRRPPRADPRRLRQHAPQDTWQPAGDNAQKIHNLQWPVFAIAGVVLVIVAAAVVYVIRFQDRGQPIPKQTHGKPTLEIGLTILPALILIGVAMPTVGTLIALAKTDDTECVVNVTGHQWWWEMDYPDPEGLRRDRDPDRHQRPDDHPDRDQRHDPRHQPRRDPQLVDPPPERQERHGPRSGAQPAPPEADKPGIYAGQCAEFCGLSPRQHAHGGRRADGGGLRDLEGQPVRGVHVAGTGHIRRRGRGDVHPPVRPLPPGGRSDRRQERWRRKQ